MTITFFIIINFIICVIFIRSMYISITNSNDEGWVMFLILVFVLLTCEGIGLIGIWSRDNRIEKESDRWQSCHTFLKKHEDKNEV